MTILQHCDLERGGILCVLGRVLIKVSCWMGRTLANQNKNKWREILNSLLHIGLKISNETFFVNFLTLWHRQKNSHFEPTFLFQFWFLCICSKMLKFIVHFIVKNQKCFLKETLLSKKKFLLEAPSSSLMDQWILFLAGYIPLPSFS